nr:AraC family transcriptional regulator [Arachnia propionica]
MSSHCVPSAANTTSVPAMLRVDSQEPLITRAARFLGEHFREPVTIRDLADHLSYSASHLTRTFTRVVGASPMRYLAARRFQEAKYLLAAERLDVLQACHEVGYSSVGTFSRRFVADVGLAPGEFRRAADRVCETELAAVSLWIPQTVARVRVRLDIPPEMKRGLGEAPYQWIGTFATPVPCGPPVTGTLRRGIAEVELPVHPAGPWLLATLTPSSADVGELLWPGTPFVARHPVPVTGAEKTIMLPLRAARSWEYPLLVALPALHPRI